MLKKLINKYYQSCRRFLFRKLSTNKRVIGIPKINQPALMIGEGEIHFGNQVVLGYYPSPFYYTGSIHLEARDKNAAIIFGNGIYINNNAVIICDKSSIEIGDHTLIGCNVEIIDSDFHEIHPAKRNSGNHISKPVKIGKNVFIGSNVKILKGVSIGDNSIVSNGAIVYKDIPANVIASGNPALPVKNILI